MKKLNKKGFTLIELLAVIVILAIIVVVTVPTILNSIDDARASSIHSLAKEVANWYDTSYAQDLITTNSNNKILGDVHLDHSSQTTNWVCLSDINGETAGTPDLAKKYGLSATDLNLGTTGAPEAGAATATSAICSAIRLNNGRAEVLLVGKETGKFGKRYAFSSQDASADYTS